MSTTKNTEEKEENILSSILFRFAPYWPLFIFLLFVCGIGGWFYLRYATPMYYAASKILIKDQKKGVDDSKIVESFDMYTSKSIIENEIEVVRSRELMKQVVTNLHFYAPVYEKGSFKDQNAYVSSPVSIEVQEPDEIKKTEPVFFTYNSKKGSINIEKQNYPLNQWITTPYGILKFKKNLKAYKTPGGTLYFLLLKPINVANSFVNNLTLKPTGKVSTVLNLSFTDESPDRAQDVLNELMTVYAQSTINEKNSLAANTLSFIEERLKYIVKDLDSIERTIQRYKSQKGIVDLSEQARVFLQNVGNNDRQAGTISMELAVLDQVESYVVSKDKNAGIVPSTLGINDKVLPQLLDRLYNSELEYTTLKQTMGENTPAVAALANEIERIRPAILENVRNQRSTLQASQRNISATSGAYTSMLKTIPGKERELIEISRQQAIKNDVYAFLLQKREETALSSSSTVADNKMIDAARASFTPISPKKSIIYFGAFVLAFIIGIAIVMAKELLTNKVLFRSQIEKYTNAPIVAEIISVKHSGEIVIDQEGKAYISEQFRQLRAALGFYKRGAAKKKILITSSIAGEGKSFVAANLAVSLASSGKKVVLIDADLRSPKTTSIFDLEHQKGIAEFLKNELEVTELIHTSATPNLSIIPAGGATKQPTELLLNGKLAELFTYLENLYDYVLVDISPVDPVTDAYVLSEYCDKTLFVIRHGYTPKTLVQLLDESNKIKALPKLAIVFNGVKKRGFMKGNYGFGYGYGYEYVYKDRELSLRKKMNTSLN